MSDRAGAALAPTNTDSHLIMPREGRVWKRGVFPESSYQPLWEDPATGRQAFIARFGPGGSIPMHNHPGREFAYVLEGEMRVGRDRMGPGDFITAADGDVHDVWTETGVTFFIVVDQPIMVLAEDES